MSCFDAESVCDLFNPPEPHPLDFDWRFTAQSVEAICGLLPKSELVLAVGTPSIARYLQSTLTPVLLVDRQPLQGVTNHWRGEPGNGQPSNQSFTNAVAVIDPPWYPETFRRWVAWTANLIGIGAQIYASVWPPGTRPGDELEFRDLVVWLSEWADVAILDVNVRYERPTFEMIASKFSQSDQLSVSPGFGRLLSIVVQSMPHAPQPRQSRFLWKRFLLNDYQLAVRLTNDDSLPTKLERHPNARNWIWPYVSYRAPRRDDIGAWSSHNEVGIVQNSAPLIDALRRAFQAESETKFIEVLDHFRALLEWQIPRPPYRRYCEWEHHQ